MDALCDMLNSANLSGGMYFRCEFTAPWGLQIPQGPMAEFHIVVRGQCWLRVPSAKSPVPLRAGDIAVFMSGGPHALVDSPKGKAFPPDVVLKGQNLEHFGPVTYGGDGPPATVLCGYFKFDRESRNPMIDALPPLIHIRGTDGKSDLESVVTLMMEESRAKRPGAEVVVNRLCEVLFVRIVRAHLEQMPEARGLLPAMVDPQIGTALNLIHQSLHEPWTLATLACKLGMSRSTLAGRFHQLVGKPPIQYLTEWRMETARRLLSQSRLPQAVIAERVGYGSEAAFSKGFKRLLGVAPGAYRRQVAARPAAP